MKQPCPPSLSFFFFNDTATTEIYTLSLHDALPISDDLDEILAWREKRTVTRNLTLHYDRLVLLLDPTPLARGLVGKKVEVGNYPGGRFAVQFNGAALRFKVLGKVPTWQPWPILDHNGSCATLP